ncbi:galactosylceramide sulfotransferase-like [Liolophura sinensis]|uniref:galactosylceramide sulfotransferase-like n=1 Tax=Liolophura sinensis TaxID=3198878 RepID=UPI003158C952
MASPRSMFLCLTACVFLLTVVMLWSKIILHLSIAVPPRSTKAVFKYHRPVLRKEGKLFSRPLLSTLSSTKALVPSPINAHAKCKEKRHVIYVRIPKTGSSTMTHLMWRFGNQRGLRFLLPRPGFEGSENKLSLNKFYLPNSRKYCDLMANHVIYDYANFKRYFPADVVYISLLREPMNQLYSTIYYLNFNIQGDNKVKNYLLKPEKYEPKSGSRSLTHNPMMSYFGLAPSYFRNVDKIRQKIAEIDEKFAMVLVLEKLDESLVLLKRKLCWTTNDILYMIKNKNWKKPVVNITDEDYKRLKNWSMADYILYEHFLGKLQRSIETEGEDFQQELSLFRSIKRQFKEFCQRGNSNQTLTIASSKFSASFKVPYRNCQRLASRGPLVLDDIRRQQKLKNFCNSK